MLQAFKPKSTMLIPFMSVHSVIKDGDHYLYLLVTGKENSNSFYFESKEDRDQQFANFETWLTTPQNSI